jgi:hypothetical protein
VVERSSRANGAVFHMALRVARGLFRLWLVLSVLWIGVVGVGAWRAFSEKKPAFEPAMSADDPPNAEGTRLFELWQSEAGLRWRELPENSSRLRFLVVKNVPRGDSLSVRSGPAPTFDVVSERHNGDVLDIGGDQPSTKKQGKQSWIRICLDSDCMEDGWVNSHFVAWIEPITFPKTTIPISAECHFDWESPYLEFVLSWNSDKNLKIIHGSRITNTLLISALSKDEMKFVGREGIGLSLRFTDPMSPLMVVSDPRLFDPSLDSEDRKEAVLHCIPTNSAYIERGQVR